MDGHEQQVFAQRTVQVFTLLTRALQHYERLLRRGLVVVRQTLLCALVLGLLCPSQPRPPPRSTGAARTGAAPAR